MNSINNQITRDSTTLPGSCSSLAGLGCGPVDERMCDHARCRSQQHEVTGIASGSRRRQQHQQTQLHMEAYLCSSTTRLLNLRTAITTRLASLCSCRKWASR